MRANNFPLFICKQGIYMRIFFTALKIYFLLVLSSCSGSYSEESFKDSTVEKIKKYQIHPTKELLDFTAGHPPAIGSSLCFIEKKDNDLYFYSISDRGPNSPISYKDLTKVIFFAPEYSPVIAKIKVTGKEATIVDFFNVINLNDKKITGMPTNGIEGPNFYEIPVNDKIEDIGEYDVGMDSESIAVDREGNIWVGEEYDPAIIKIDAKTKKVTKIYKPGEGLPEFVKYRQINRGFESLTVAPNGKVYALIEGVLNFDSKAISKSSIIRMLEIDPKTDKVRTFAYPYDYGAYKAPKNVKIGDLAAIDNNEFLLIEQGKTSNGSMRNVIYKINISEATDITNYIAPDGLHLEHLSPGDFNGVKMIKKSMLLDANKYGWDEEKLEGLAIVDNKTIALTNDNDFGIEEVKLNKECQDLSCNRYEVIKPQEKQHTKLWVVEFSKPFH